MSPPAPTYLCFYILSRLSLLAEACQSLPEPELQPKSDFFYWPCPQHVEVPKLGGQILATAVTMPDPAEPLGNSLLFALKIITDDGCSGS